MGASFVRFLRTGQLGPLTLGMDPAAVELQLGRPEARSRKLNPLLLKYGPLELTFWSRRSQPPQLAQVLLSVIHGLADLPLSLRFDDWMPEWTTNFENFGRFLTQIGIRPEEVRSANRESGNRESSIVLPSGLVASFSDGQLIELVLSKREREESRQPVLTDERESSAEQVRHQLRDARTALDQGLKPAAVLLAWAALEAALRRRALRAGYAGKIRVQPTILIRELYALGHLNSEQVQALESARQQRTTIAHGLPSPPVDRDDVLQIIGLAEYLLNH